MCIAAWRGSASCLPKGAAGQNTSLCLIQFLAALTGEETSLSASAPELVSFSLKLDSWTSQIHPKIEDVPFRTCFRLEAPGVEDDDDDNAWRLAFFLQAKDDKSLLVPAKEVWQTKSRALTFLKKRLKNPQEQLLADLGKASRVVPLMEKCLESARPTGLEMQTEEAYSFLRESAPLLEQNGFGVLLPSWWERPGSRLGIKLQLKGAVKKEGQVGPAFFGLDSLVNYDWQLSLGGDILTEAEFAELSRLKVPLIQIRGEWMELRSTEIEAAIEFFQKNRDREMTLAEALRLGLNLPGQSLSGRSCSMLIHPYPFSAFRRRARSSKCLKPYPIPAVWRMSRLPRSSRAPCALTSCGASPGWNTCTG